MPGQLHFDNLDGFELDSIALHQPGCACTTKPAPAASGIFGGCMSGDSPVSFCGCGVDFNAISTAPHCFVVGGMAGCPQAMPTKEDPNVGVRRCWPYAHDPHGNPISVGGEVADAFPADPSLQQLNLPLGLMAVGALLCVALVLWRVFSSHGLRKQKADHDKSERFIEPHSGPGQSSDPKDLAAADLPSRRSPISLHSRGSRSSFEDSMA